ncbi:MAG: cysteine desulfurase family protein [Acidimicrobiales bacterium]
MTTPSPPTSRNGDGGSASENDDVVYLDHGASTPMYPEALEVMTGWLGRLRGNPSGAHRLAREARRTLDDARDLLAEGLGCGPGDVVFTSGGTEADNLAIFGSAGVGPDGVRSLVACSAAEHHAVLEPVTHMGGLVLAVDRLGRLDVDALRDTLPTQVGLVSAMLVNNEVGVINPVADIVEVVRSRTAGTALVHVDAVAAFPWLDVGAATASADLLSISAHKFGGPPGVGVLVVRPGVPLRARLLGGGQERDRRSGTQNVAGVAAMAEAARLTVARQAATVARVTALRDRLVDEVQAQLPGVTETVADRSVKVAGNAHLCVQGVVSEELLFVLDRHGVAVSVGSSCASGATQLSHVLAAMGLDRQQGAGALRCTLGWSTTDAHIDRAVAALVHSVRTLRSAALVPGAP